MSATPEVIAATEIGQRVRAARARLGYQREQLAAISGISYGGLTKIEDGRAVPGGETLMRLAAALGVSVEGLLPPNYMTLFPPLVKPQDRIAAFPASAPVAQSGGGRYNVASISGQSQTARAGREAAGGTRKARAGAEQAKRSTRKGSTTRRLAIVA